MLSELVTHDCDHLASCLAATEQVYRQLKPGKFSGSFRRIDLPGIHITEESMNLQLALSVWTPPEYMAILIPIQQQGSISIEGHDGSVHDLFLGQPGITAEMRLTPEYRCFSVEFELDALRRAADKLQVGLPDNLPCISRLPNAQATTALRTVVKQSFATLVQRAALAGEVARADCSDRILRTILNAINAAAGRPEDVGRSTAVRRRKAALYAADFIKSSLADPVSVTDLCEVTGVSERSLRNGFLDVFGVTPNRYIKVQRLSAARLELRRASRESATVSQIAARWGFLQFAHFATDYRAHFGELPSETLAWRP
jgi:AraC family ethanolamine operon transcriptional activator